MSFACTILWYTTKYNAVICSMAQKSTIRRRIKEVILSDLEKKMVLLAGPRQCGKTTLAKILLKKIKGAYYNWDIDEHKKLIRTSELDLKAKLWVFDEIHKYKYWRNWLKGTYDLHRDKHKILVSGSAKLDFYSRGGDSLQGRYYFHRLHPFTLSELLDLEVNDLEKIPEIETNANHNNAKKVLNELLQFGGFPEPFCLAQEQEAARWRLTYSTRLIREDIRDLEKVFDLDKMEVLYEHLPLTVGSVLSINSLREDLEVNFRTVKNWIEIFERNYVCFKVPPLGSIKIKAVKKEHKLYFWDWGFVEKYSARCENLIAMHLLRLCHWICDVYGQKAELRYFRDVRGREVDFIIIKKGKPWIAIEVKESDIDIDPNLKYLLERVKIPFAFQVHFNSNKFKRLPNINDCKTYILPAHIFLANLP